MHRILLAALLLLLPAAQAAAGPGRPFPFDSLRATVRQPALADTERVYKALEAYQALIYTRPDSAGAYARQAMGLARRIHWARGEANAYGALAGLEYQLKRYAPAQRYYQLMLAAARQAHHPALEGSAYAAMASMALNTGNPTAGQRYYQLARAAFRRVQPRSYNNEVLVLVNLSNYHLEHRLPPGAALVRQAVALLPRTTWPELPPATLLNLGQVQARQHQPDSAAASWRQVIQLASAAHLDELTGQAYSRLAELHLSQHQPALALAEARQALTLAHHSQATAPAADALGLLARAMQALHQPAAFDTLQRAQALLDSVHAQENAAALSLAQARFNDAEQQVRIRELEQQRQLSQQAQELARLRTQRTVIGLGGLLLLAVGLAGAGLWQYRRRQQHREAALRQRLAADLHDDVGNLLTQVSLQADLLRETPGATPAQVLARLQRLSDTSRLATRQMADVVRGLHASTLTLPELLAHLREHAHEVLVPAGLAVDFAVAPEVEALHPAPATCQHLYLIYKESLHNVVKHARAATLVAIRLYRDGPCLCLRVQDDGQPLASAAPGRPAGHGLRNMRQRAEAVGGTLRLEPAATGFAVVACLPA